jgi:hypothetical protein
MARGAHIGLDGTDGMISMLRELERGLQRKYAREAVAASGKVIAESIRMRVPVGSGLLRQSIAVKSVVYYGGRAKRRSGIDGSTLAIAIIGADAAVKEVRGTRTYKSTYKGKNYVTLKDRIARPVRYAHLAEYGFTGPDGNFVRGHGFMRGGFAAAEEPAMEAMAVTLRAGLMTEGVL